MTLSFDITPRIAAIPATANSIVPSVASIPTVSVFGIKLITAKAADIVPNKIDNDPAAAKAF